MSTTVKDQIKRLIFGTDLKQFGGDRDALFLFVQQRIANADDKSIVAALGEAAAEKRAEGEGYTAEADALDAVVTLRRRGETIAEKAMEEIPLPWSALVVAKFAKSIATGTLPFLRQQGDEAYEIAVGAIMTGFFQRLREREEYHRRLVTAMLNAPRGSMEDMAGHLMPEFADATSVQFDAASKEVLSILEYRMEEASIELAAAERWAPLYEGVTDENMTLVEVARAKAKTGDPLAVEFLKSVGAAA